MTITKGGQDYYQTDWRNLTTTSDEMSSYNVGEEWVDFPEFSDGSYSVECRVRYSGDSEEYTSNCAFSVTPQGTSCHKLEFNPDTIPAGGTTTATCDVTNADGGKRRITTDYEQGPT